MSTQLSKRLLSFLLAMIMIFSAVPVQVFAAEDHEHANGDSIPVTGQQLLQEGELNESSFEQAVDLAKRINAILNVYGITADMMDAQIGEAIVAQPWSENRAYITEVEQIQALADEIPQIHAEYVLAKADVETYVRLVEVLNSMQAVAPMAASGTHTPVAGVEVSVGGASDNSMSGGAVTVTAKGSGGIFGYGASAKTATIDVSNTSGSKAKISFNWTATSVNELKIDGTKYAGSSGSFEKVLDAGEKFTVTITTAKNSTTNKLVMSGFACVATKESSKVTFQYDSALGSVTVAGSAVEPGAQVDVPSAGAALVATPASGVTFLGWIDANTHVIVSREKTFNLEPADDMTVQAVFTTTTPWFLVNGNALYGSLNDAVTAAGSVSNKTIALANSGTLPAGNYTIPSGVTLLIPFDAANTLHTTAPATTDVKDYSAPTVYRKLTMAEGANITVNGAISLSGTQHSSMGHSAPFGPTSFIEMKSNSSITVNNGGKLYVWGYITGSGSVTVKSGATVYECFIVRDWLGGDNTTGMLDNKQRVFPFSQYYVQNVEVPMTMEAGATEKGYMSVSVTLVGVQGAAVPFIGSDGMFNITSGHIVKDYDESTGRLLLNVYGSLGVNSLTLSMKLGILGSSTIKSQNYVLPINGNMTVTMHSGGSITMTQDIMMQPGARLIVDEGATCTLGQGNKIYVYDYAEWKLSTGVQNPVAEGPSYCGLEDKEYINLLYPASAKTVQGRSDDAYVEINGTADLSAGYVYTTAGGANICGTGTIIMKPGTETVTYQVKTLGSDNKDLKYVTIPITSAKLKNADGSYVITANDLGVVTYNGATGAWVCDHECEYVGVVTTDATCTAAGVKTFTCLCGEDSYTVEIPALGHDEVDHAAQAPTCTAVGWDAYVSCSRCDYSTYAEKAALGHDEVSHEAKAPTCTEIGWDAYVTCSRCDYTTYAEKTALGHNPGADADCVNAQTCGVCGIELAPALGHVWEWIVDQEANFLYPGIKHEECSRCHAKQNENTQIPVLVCPHTGTLTVTAAKAATCTEHGNTLYSYCSTCQNYYNDETGKNKIEKDSWIIPALGHDEVGHEAKAHTCTEIGWDAYVTCSRCDYTTYAEKSALGHDEVAHEAKAPNCMVGGWDAYVTCSRCDYTTKVELPKEPNAHIWDEGEPWGTHSCNSPSYIQYTCQMCKKTERVIDREQHFRVPIAQEIPATCTADGMTSGWKCEKCDEFWIPQEVIPALGHDWNGNYPCQSEISACTRCDLHFDTMQEHLTIVDAAIPATCTATGLSEGSHCGYCGQTLVAQTETPMTDHNWIVADMEIPANCNNVGHKEDAKYCLDCNYDADPIPALEHQWMHRDAKKATYSAVGWNAHDYCLLCKATKTTEQYEKDPCEFCGDNTEGYVEIPMVEIQKCKTLDEFLTNIGYLEQMAALYAKDHPGTDPLGLVLNYMRTGVENYTSGSWAIMAGPEDKDFLKFVQDAEDTINSDPNLDVWINVSGLKKIGNYRSPTSETNYYTNSTLYVMSGHFFGTMDMTYHNKGSQNHADVGGWVGDLTDLLSTTDELGVDPSLTLEEKVAFIRENYLFSNTISGAAGSFGHSDLYADLEAFYFMNELITKGYETGDLEKLMREFYDSKQSLQKRVAYLLENRLDGLSTRQDLRTAVYNAYTSNKLISTLEGTRNFNAKGSELSELRKAVCYAFADEMCFHAGDYVEDLENPRFTVFDRDTQILAPGISQQVNFATNADGKQIVYYVATADISRDDVGLWVNYYDRDPGTPENPEWKNSTVPNSAQNAQDRYGNPESADYIPNFNVVASTNAGGYSMQNDATPGGLIVMNGIEWYPQKGTAGFFAILDDGTAYMGTHDEYETMKDRIQEAIGGFGEFVVRDGVVVGSDEPSDAPRTSVGITSTGRVVLMCIDGRQAPFSSGASLQDVGYIMKEAGCVVAINLDGGGSTTFVARQPGEDELTVMNRPSDGYPRNVSTNLLVYSTAPSSTTFDHAVIESQYDYATVNTPVQMTAAGISPSGNAVDVPEGATWAVSDEEWASITEDGVFTGKRLGEVTVYLMLDGKTVGSKLMTMSNPDQLYFEKAKMDGIYGSSIVLPLRARYEGKAIAINPDDVTITLSAPNAGTMDGFTFQVAETNIKTLSITAAIGEDIKASINVMLYKQGENSFDFDKATGGDRMLAWYRQVSNAKVEDGNTYHVIDPAKDMVASYTFAMDMTAIPIPERLSELTYMLPGGTMEGTNAWSFLTSLAQRISDLSWVKATIDFDDRVVVDYSEMTILNDYFELTGTEFDEATNTLTLTMNWIKQSQVIDEATANPLCLINGIKLTPKSGVWDDVSKITVVASGTIGYEIYMRASGLYSFAQKPENQAVFGVYPYRNPNDTTDAGGYFSDIYAQITDEYTLVNVLKEGWVNEDGGFAYYVDGERLTGVQEVEGFYYDFGEHGVNVGQTKFTGVFFDKEAAVYRYSYLGVLTSGWQMINNEWYYFDSATMAAVSGKRTISHVPYEFEENGRLVSGVWMNVFVGYRYYYGPDYVHKQWYQIGDDLYYFRDGVAVTGDQNVAQKENISKRMWYRFDENGVCQGPLTDIEEIDGKLYYIENGVPTEKGLFKHEGYHYYSRHDGSLVVDASYYAWKLDETAELPVGTYEFDAQGRLLGYNFGEGGASGIVDKDGVLYYYENGKPVEKGLFVLDGAYYYSRSGGKLVVGESYYAWKLDASSELPVGTYEFGADGRMLQGIVEKDDILYYYENGKGVEKGLFVLDGAYYYSASGGKLVVGESYYAWKVDASSELPVGTYEFGADGRMLHGIVIKDGVLYYYENGKGIEKGLFVLDGAYYYSRSGGKLVVSESYYAWKVDASSELPVGTYEFGADGRMMRGIVTKDGVPYYYENGKPVEKGLFVFNGEYYYSRYNGALVVDGSYYAWKVDASSELPVGTYEFGADGRMLQGIVDKDGVLYYYENGKPTEKGLFVLDGEYYYSRYNGAVVVDNSYYAWKVDASSELPVGTYEFGADGRMLQGIVDKDGVLYYYENGKPTEKGLFVLDGEHYYSRHDGSLVAGASYYAWKLDKSAELGVATYQFDASGKVIGAKKSGEIVNVNGELFYYESGKPVDKGLFMLDGYYYFTRSGGKLVVSQDYYVWMENEYLMVNTYTFNELGQIVG